MNTEQGFVPDPTIEDICHCGHPIGDHHTVGSFDFTEVTYCESCDVGVCDGYTPDPAA